MWLWFFVALSQVEALQSEGTIVLPLLPHHVVHSRRLAEGKNTALTEPKDTLVDPLYQGLGTHYVDLWVGCPPQRQTLIIDTGSDVAAFPCSGCEDCGTDDYHADAVFNETASTCFKSISCEKGCEYGECNEDTDVCDLAMVYAEGSSWFAFEATDKAYTGGSHDGVDVADRDETSFDLRFGCQTSLSGLFVNQLADGILGMTMTEPAYWRQMYTAGKISEQKFSLCYIHENHVTREGTGAGAMIMGGSDPRLHKTPMVFTKIIKSQTGFYAMYLEKLYLRTGTGNDHSIAASKSGQKWTTLDISEKDLNSGGTIIDSGTTSTLLSEKIKEPFIKAFKAATHGKYEYGDSVKTIKEVMSLPTIILQMNPWNDNNDPDQPGIAGEHDPDFPDSILVTFAPTQYMKWIEKREAYEPKIFFSKPPGQIQTLGANFMSGKDILFDIDNYRLGFAESDCDYFAMGFENFNHTPSHPGVASCEGLVDCYKWHFIVLSFVVAVLTVVYRRRAEKGATFTHDHVPLSTSETELQEYRDAVVDSDEEEDEE